MAEWEFWGKKARRPARPRCLEPALANTSRVAASRWLLLLASLLLPENPDSPGTIS